MPDLSSTPRTALERHRERGRTDSGDLHAVLICHLEVVVNGEVPGSATGAARQLRP